MKPAVIIAGAAALRLATGPAAAQGAGPSAPPWGAPGVVVSGGPAAFGPFGGAILGRGPVGCYFTRVRANNRWLRAEICDWYYGFGAP